ncbi:MAG: D-tyrosyl-tRNA(Tyr) deacylase [Clostridia bacterium]|nr:D-tyrosyl-tRNA(Tyr) deacylase [Clostridia bacterium]
MKAVLQRVTHSSVTVDDKIIGKTAEGFLILLGVEKGDDQKEAQALARKIAGLRVFCDENDKMNLSLADINGGVLVISNFTLCADCRKGRRPSFDNAALPDEANSLYEYFCTCLREQGVAFVEQGEFGADMKVSLLNDGPVTLIIDSRELAK